MSKLNQLDFIVKKKDEKLKKKIFIKYISSNSPNIIKSLVNDIYFVEEILNVKNKISSS